VKLFTRTHYQVASGSDEGVRVLSLRRRSSTGSSHGGAGSSKDQTSGKTFQHLDSVTSTATSDSDSDDDEDDDVEEEDGASTLVAVSPTQSTLTLSFDRAAGDLLHQDSIAGRLAKLFDDDVREVIATVLSLPDSPEKMLLAEETARALRGLRSAVTLNCHFAVLSSLCAEAEHQPGELQEDQRL